MSPDDPSEPSGRGRRSWDPNSYRDRDDDAVAAPTRASVGRRRLERVLRTTPVRGRRVRRTVRHVDPWSALKLALLFHAAMFLIICVASAVLWTGARASGSLDNLESFITSVGGFGNCEPIAGSTASSSTTSSTSTTRADDEEDDADQINPANVTTTEPEADRSTDVVDTDEDCSPGNHLVGEFKFEDIRIFQAFILGGVVLVLAGTGAVVVMVLLFNLMSDLTGGIRVWVIEEDPRPRRSDAGSPPPRRRD